MKYNGVLKLQNKIPIFLSSDNNYAPFVATTIASICDNTKSFCEFYILDGGISNENKLKINELKKQFNNFSTEFVHIEEKYFQDFITNGYVSTATYYRFIISQLYPNLKKILYLDVDIIANGDISQLFNEDLENYIIGAVEDTGNKYYIKRLKYNVEIAKNHTYFNAGILLIDNQKWVEKNITKELFKIEEKYRTRLECNDQDILNKYFENNYKILANKYNSRKVEDDTVIRHFYQPIKPWQININTKLGAKLLPDYEIFWKYAKMTPFAEELTKNCKFDTEHKIQVRLIYKKNEEQKNAKISIIIPIYNTEKYLQKCLDTVSNQSMLDIEIICVNDCSTDNSLNILKEYAQYDNRIKIINFEENKGVSVARNEGIKAAKGEYIGFVDSDDWIDSDFYEKLYNKAKKNNADIAKGCYETCGNIDEYLNNYISVDKNIFIAEFASAIYKANLIKDNNIAFPPLSYLEDPIFSFKSSLLANNVLTVNDALVHVVKREDSATSGIPSFKRISDELEGLLQIIEIANNTNNLKKGTYLFIVNYWFLGVLANCLKNDDSSCRKTLYNKLISFSNIIKYQTEFYNELGTISKNCLNAIKDKDYSAFLKCKHADIQAALVIKKIRHKMNKKEMVLYV